MFNKPAHGKTRPFRIPNIVGRRYAPGPQPNNPGESVEVYGGYPGGFYHGIPWPNVVPTINALANFAGLPRDYPIGIVNNANAPLPSNILFIGGFAGKSKG